MNTATNRFTDRFVLFYDNFISGMQPNTKGSPYTFFSAPNAGLIDADDAFGGVYTSCDELIIKSVPYIFTSPDFLDHYKYVVFQKQTYNAYKEGDLVYEGIVSVQQTGLEDLPVIYQSPNSVAGVNDTNSDCRLCCGMFNATDPDNLLNFDFKLTNTDIYAFYERLNYGSTAYTGFTHCIPLAKRQSNEYVKLSLKYNYVENTVSWYINDVMVYFINNLGLPLDQKYRICEQNIVGDPPAPSTLIRPKRLEFGFGTISLFNMYNPQNPGRNTNNALVDLSSGLNYINPVYYDVFGNGQVATYLDTYSGTTNFGQGLILKIKYLTVYLEGEFKHLKCGDSTILNSKCQQCLLPGVNSIHNLINKKCTGYISNCDVCEPFVVCGCQCETVCGCANKHKCQGYKISDKCRNL